MLLMFFISFPIEFGESPRFREKDGLILEILYVKAQSSKLLLAYPLYRISAIQDLL